MLKTERLVIRLSSDDEMRELIESESDEEMKTAYSEMRSFSLADPSGRQWYAAWFIELHSGEHVGDLCFKGLTSDGSVEIGYGILSEFQGCGYATEAVRAMTEWAISQPGVKRVEAETEEDNKASRRVLEKAGFIPAGENGVEGPRFCFTPRSATAHQEKIFSGEHNEL